MLAAFVEGMIDGFNRGVEVGRLDVSATRVMIGYLSAASIGLRCNGMDQEAQAFLEAASAIESDWTCYERAIRELAERYR